MLLYHPAFDIYHCIFRLLLLLSESYEKIYEIKQIRILDFYFVFPDQLAKVRFPKDARRYRKIIGDESSSYESIDNPQRIFLQLEPIQTAALNCLVSYGFIDSELYDQNKLMLTNKAIPSGLTEALEKTKSENEDLIDLLSGPFSKLELIGSQGLKARTNLLEFRYDPN